MIIADVSRATSGAKHGAEDAAEAPAAAASVALVPVAAIPRRLAPAADGPTRPDPSFVAHLIAMAQSSPQTRMLRRAAPEDVLAAYRSAADQNRSMPGVRMRQVA